MEMDRRDRTLQVWYRAFNHSIHEAQSGTLWVQSQSELHSETGRKGGKREGRREKEKKYKKLKQAKTQTNRIYPCSFKQTNAKFSSLPKIPARSSY